MSWVNRETTFFAYWFHSSVTTSVIIFDNRICLVKSVSHISPMRNYAINYAENEGLRRGQFLFSIFFCWNAACGHKKRN